MNKQGPAHLGGTAFQVEGTASADALCGSVPGRCAESKKAVKSGEKVGGEVW